MNKIINKNYIGKLLLFVILYTLTTSCKKNERTIDNASRKIVIEYDLGYNSSSDDSKEAVTKGLTPDGTEEVLNEVAMMFFDKKTGNQTTTHPTHPTLPSVTPITKTNNGTVVVDMPSGLPIGDYDILLMGNLNSYLRSEYPSTKEYLATFSGNSFSEVKKGICAFSLERIISTSISPLALSAVSSVSIPDTYSDLKIDVQFKRAVARIDLTNNAKSNFELVWAKVCNYRTEAAIFDHKDNLGSLVPGISTTPSTTDDRGVIGVGTGTESQSILAGLYTFPNITTDVTETSNDASYLIIAGKFDKSLDTTYYRVNIKTSLSVLQLISANHLYNMKILQVKGAGTTTESAAAAAPTTMIIFEGNNWEGNLNEDNKMDADGNMLAVGATSVILEGTLGSTFLLKVKANGGKWASEFIINSNSFTAVKEDEGVRITTTAANTTTFPKSAELKVYNTANTSLTYTITLYQLSN